MPSKSSLAYLSLRGELIISGSGLVRKASPLLDLSLDLLMPKLRGLGEVTNFSSFLVILKVQKLMMKHSKKAQRRIEVTAMAPP